MPPARRQRNHQQVMLVPRRHSPPRTAAQADPDLEPQDPIPAPGYPSTSSTRASCDFPYGSTAGDLDIPDIYSCHV